MDWAMARPSNTSPPVCPAAAVNDLIKPVILGSRDIFTANAAEPSTEREPVIRPAQENNGSKIKIRQKK
jgi:hypothetical protein